MPQGMKAQPEHPELFDRPGEPYRTEMPAVCRRAMAVADLLDVMAVCETGRPPPNLSRGIRTLLHAIGDDELVSLSEAGRQEAFRARLAVLSMVVQAEVRAARERLPSQAGGGRSMPG